MDHRQACDQKRELGQLLNGTETVSGMAPDAPAEVAGCSPRGRRRAHGTGEERPSLDYAALAQTRRRDRREYYEPDDPADQPLPDGESLDSGPRLRIPI